VKEDEKVRLRFVLDVTYKCYQFTVCFV